jgi:DNA-binding CsgD family transcriptional regulator
VLVPFESARRGDSVAQLQAHALRLVAAVVPAAVAVFFTVSRRLEIGHGVYLVDAPGRSRAPRDWAEQVARPDAGDPFPPRRMAERSAAVVAAAEVTDPAALAASPYGRFLRRHGLGDQVAVYLRAAGAIVGGIVLIRDQDAQPFGAPELALMRRLQPLLEHVYVQAREPALAGDGRQALLMASLTSREAEVAQLVGGGSTNAEIARALYMSLATVKTHLSQIYAKLGVRNRTQLAILLRPPPDG